MARLFGCGEFDYRASNPRPRLRFGSMLPKLKQYLASVRGYSKLDPTAEGEIVRELHTHFEDEIDELCETGFSPTEAVDVATERFGAAEELGRHIYEVHSRGTWGQALLSAIPHLLIALTFVLHLWRDSFWLLAMALAITTVTIYAWYHGKPAWFYSWLGYFLIPLLAIGFLVLFAIGGVLSLVVLERSMLWVVVLAYIPVALWLSGSIFIRVMRRDWLFASLMLLPFPVIVEWLIALGQDGGLGEYSRQGFQGSDPRVALTFLAMGGTAATFIRLRQRLLKIGVLSVATLLILAMVWRFAESGFNPVASFFVSLCLVGFLLSPALLEHRVVHGGEEMEFWDEAWLEQVTKRT